MRVTQPINHTPPAKYTKNPDYTGVYGPTRPIADVKPYLAANLLRKGKNNVDVQGGGVFYHTAKVILLVGLLILPLNLGFYFTFKEIKRFYTSPVYKSYREKQSYIEHEIHMAKFMYDRYKGKYKNHKISLSRFISYHDHHIYLFIGLLLSTILILWPGPYPIRFDRQRRLVYTYYKSHVYLVSFDAMPMVAIAPKMEQGGKSSDFMRGTSLLCFYRWQNGHWDFGTFGIAANRYFGEPKQGFYANRVWNWMIDYMDKGPEAVPEPVKGTGWLNLLSPIQRKLPEDIDAQVDHILTEAGGLPPGDANLPSRESRDTAAFAI